MVSPFVSVIIPVYNDQERFNKCLQGLARQTYSSDLFEVLAVDNGSTPPICTAPDAPTNTLYLTESTPGSYAARNRALSEARGDILAFTDSDCIPDERWIENGVHAVSKLSGPGLIAGRIDVHFKDPAHPTWVELHEREFAFRQNENAARFHYGATANVFAPRTVFDKVGLFDASLKSGGDREWGNRVFNAGFTVAYADDVRVQHPARHSAGEYISKLRRIVHGHYALRHHPDKRHLCRMSNTLRGFLPPRKEWASIGQSGASLTLLEKLKIAGFVVTKRYYANLLRLKLLLLGENKNTPR